MWACGTMRRTSGRHRGMEGRTEQGISLMLSTPPRRHDLPWSLRPSVASTPTLRPHRKIEDANACSPRTGMKVVPPVCPAMSAHGDAALQFFSRRPQFAATAVPQWLKEYGDGGHQEGPTQIPEAPPKMDRVAMLWARPTSTCLSRQTRTIVNASHTIRQAPSVVLFWGEAWSPEPRPVERFWSLRIDDRSVTLRSSKRPKGPEPAASRRCEIQ